MTKSSTIVVLIIFLLIFAGISFLNPPHINRRSSSSYDNSPSHPPPAFFKIDSFYDERVKEEEEKEELVEGKETDKEVIEEKTIEKDEEGEKEEVVEVKEIEEKVAGEEETEMGGEEEMVEEKEKVKELNRKVYTVFVQNFHESKSVWEKIFEYGNRFPLVKKGYTVVFFFNSREYTPFVNAFTEEFDSISEEYCVAAYWKYSNGTDIFRQYPFKN